MRTKGEGEGEARKREGKGDRGKEIREKAGSSSSRAGPRAAARGVTKRHLRLEGQH